MKNSRVRTLLFGLLLLTSIFSYIFINTISVNTCEVKCNVNQMLEEEATKNAELPDVKLFKKLIETGRQLVPATNL